MTLSPQSLILRPHCRILKVIIHHFQAHEPLNSDHINQNGINAEYKGIHV